MKRESNPYKSIVRFLDHDGFYTSLCERCNPFHSLDWLAHIPSQVNLAFFIRDVVYIDAQVVQLSKFKFHLWCCSAANKPGQYPGEVTQEHKHCFAARKPIQYLDEIVFFTSPHMKCHVLIFILLHSTTRVDFQGRGCSGQWSRFMSLGVPMEF